jgi:hypothetical protein
MCLAVVAFKNCWKKVRNGAQELYILNRFQWVGHQWQLGRELMQKQANPGCYVVYMPEKIMKAWNGCWQVGCCQELCNLVHPGIELQRDEKEEEVAICC